MTWQIKFVIIRQWRSQNEFITPNLGLKTARLEVSMELSSDSRLLVLFSFDIR